MAHLRQLGRPKATPRLPSTAKADQPDSPHHPANTTGRSDRSAPGTYRDERGATTDAVVVAMASFAGEGGQFSDSLRREVISVADSARSAARSRRSALIRGMPISLAAAAQLAS